MIVTIEIEPLELLRLLPHVKAVNAEELERETLIEYVNRKQRECEIKFSEELAAKLIIQREPDMKLVQSHNDEMPF